MKIQPKLLFSALALAISTPALASIHIDKKAQKVRMELQKAGVKIEAGAQTILHQHLKKNKAENKGLYSVTFVCRHSLKKKTDRCDFSSLNYRKSKSKKSK